MAFFVVTARWMYAEASLMAPSTLPLINSALEKIAIPTHDTWAEHFASAKELVARLQEDNKDLIGEVFDYGSFSKAKDHVSYPKASVSYQRIMAMPEESLTQTSLALEQSRS